MNGDPSLRRQQTLDALVYIFAVTFVLFAVSYVLGFVLGSGWPGVKNMLFVLGFLAFGVAAFQLRPTAPWKDQNPSRDATPSSDSSTASRRSGDAPPRKRPDAKLDEVVSREPPHARHLARDGVWLGDWCLESTTFTASRNEEWYA
ncbi:DUF7555 family protein [Haladaptatus sp. GCM10025893]|uniref:DUF7555 family protein n=1 Tax=Haladaptatus sp. GCM10025893 TaxID=3252659 RepID=UPI003619477C